MHSNKETEARTRSMNRKQELLKMFKLDRHYTDGSGDWLSCLDEQGNECSVLDVTGSYGINLLGHKDPALVEALLDQIKNGPPAFIQASSNPALEILSNEIRRNLWNETGHADWLTEFANTGTEIIESALKLAVLRYADKLEERKQEVYASINMLSSTDFATIEILLKGLEHLESEMVLLHMENSFHGKTLGSLSGMGNEHYKAPFPVPFKTHSLPKNKEAISEIFNALEVEYYVLNKRNKTLVRKSFLPVVALLIEAVQGEAGVFIQDQLIVDQLIELRDRHQFTIIADEIQCGLFRTGKFAALSHFNQTADIYCFGKALGGGLTKISLLAADGRYFDSNFFTYHSSSFGEDSHSVHIALRSIELIKNYYGYKENVLPELLNLTHRFPEIVKEVRGIGHMWAIELHSEYLNSSYLRKYFKDNNLLGYWVSSVLLNQENIRILPSLSGPLTFRIQPSLKFGCTELAFLKQGLENFFENIQSGDITYLFSHFLPVLPYEREKQIPEILSAEHFPENAAVFLCHPVDIPHYKRIVDLIDGYSEEELESHIEEMSDMQKFTPYHVCTIGNSEKERVNVVFLGIPFTSDQFYQSLRSGKRQQMIRVIQDAVDLANEKNARVIGLGQYTSIVTENGLRLKSDGAKITTGNSYTAQSTLEAICMAAEMSGLELSKARVGVIGAAGNIVSVIAEALLPNVGHLSLVFNGDPLASKKNLEAVAALLSQIYPFDMGTANSNELINVLSKPEVAERLSVCTDLYDLQNCDIVVCGANSSVPILTLEHLKKGTIVVDLAVPANADQEVQLSPDHVYLKGGIIELPMSEGVTQELNSVIFPFEKGESYACMAETIALAFEGNTENEFTGPITLSKLREIEQIMAKHGFRVKRLKLKDSL